MRKVFARLRTRCTALGKHVQALGKRDLYVAFNEGHTRRMELITFDIVDIEYPYNAIFGTSTLNKFSAVLQPR